MNTHEASASTSTSTSASASAAAQPEPATEALPTCRCGYSREHHFVSPKLEYSLTGWLWVFAGVNAMPKRVRMVCRQCSETVETYTDKASLESFRMGGGKH